MKIPSHCPSAVSHFSVETANPPNYSDTMNVLPEGLPSLDFAENFFAQNSFHSSSTLPLLPTNIKWNEVFLIYFIFFLFIQKQSIGIKK